MSLSGVSARFLEAVAFQSYTGYMRPIEYDFDRPWNRQPCDTPARWRTFCAFRDQPPPRTFAGASAALGGYGIRPLQRYAAECAWHDRCAEFDRRLDDIRTTVIEDVLAEDARAVANRHAGIARDAIECAHSVVRDWLVALANGESVGTWTPHEVRGMLRDMITLERLVRGEATERVEHGLTGVDLGKLTVDELETLRLLEAKAGVVD